jgi:hypothetical protein
MSIVAASVLASWRFQYGCEHTVRNLNFWETAYICCRLFRVAVLAQCAGGGKTGRNRHKLPCQLRQDIELSGKPVVDALFVTGSACVARKMGTITKNGTILPCREDGSGMPRQGNDGMIYD